MLDCGHLSDAEHGRYFLLLMLIWRSPGIRIPNDPVWIARKLRRTIDEYEKDIAPLIAEFCRSDGNWITQKRLTQEFAFLQKHSKKQRGNAKSRWNKEKDAYQSDAKQPANVMPNQSQVDAEVMPDRCQTDAPTPTPTPIYKKEAPSGAQKENRRCSLPPDFKPDAKAVEQAAKLNLSKSDCRLALSNFLDYWGSQKGPKGKKSDWQLTFRNWLRIYSENRREPRQNNSLGTSEIIFQTLLGDTGQGDEIAGETQRGHIVNPVDPPS